jgi:hypothetical protein
MALEPLPLARIRLERSLPRLLSGPALVALAGAGAITFGLLSRGALATGLIGLGVAVVLFGLAGAFVLLSVRLEVEEARIRLRWFGGDRVYPLARGAVTRVTVRGPEASSLRPRLGGFGWAIGRARLRDDETIDVVRLAPTRTVIVVPTELCRLAIAPRSEAELLEALSDAAQVRQRLEELARAAPPSDAIEPPSGIEAEAEAAGDELEPEPPHALTGIERALLEERLAAERAALTVATTSDQAAGTAVMATQLPATAGPAPAVAEPALPAARRRPRWPMPQLPPALGTSIAFMLLPLLAAGAIWGIGGALDRLPADGTDRMNVVTLTLVLGGPATAVGALMARIWWPRLIGVVVTSGLAALVVAARALLGG